MAIIKRGSKPTLKTIAGLSGLAVPTVSRALSDAPDIGNETKILVRRIAKEIGYVPNRAGVRLRTGRTNVISLVMSTEYDVMNHVGRLISSIAGELLNTPYHLIVTPYFPAEDIMRPIRYIVETGSADAVILNQIEPEDARLAYLREHNFPFVTHGRSNWSEELPYFDFDNIAFGKITMQKLAEKGRRHVVMVAPPLSQSYAHHMIDGARTIAETHGVIFETLEGANNDSPTPQVDQAMRRKLHASPSVDGIICAAAATTMASVSALEALGRRLGHDIDICAKEAVPFLSLFRPEIMAVQEDLGKAGRFLANAAVQAIREPEKPPMQGLDVPDADRFTTTRGIQEDI
ncbi:LacI family transcriptional regulator [Roseinatronobacter sp. S2]|uniref:LacI family transcriptional regulator n=1 Tax=Roseinatronobacter sp. S2 TaxID=3035471 RepID=UPI00241063AA|nr:LacI family transcriptional regulator [Roseinatronobacter sp. S2]WFE73357.1 LacI family transcriptional regulator [Roseinatronobacter sp. S2]